jgi:colanic acid/amylovoran biosynthesis glycosyltransferase
MAPSAVSEPVSVAVCLGQWLPYSETFVFDALRLQRRVRGWVIAGGRTAQAARFPYAPITVLGPLEQLGYRYAGVAPSVDRALEQSAARLVFAHFGLNGAFALPFARRRRLPLVVMFHGHDVGGLLPMNRWTPRYARYQRLAPQLFDYASLLLCASDELREALARAGAPAAKLRVQHLGIDLERFTPPAPGERAAAPTLLMVGRLVEKKGMSHGLRAFREVRRRFEAAELRIIGAGPLRLSLEREASALGVADRTRFLGALSHADVLAEMRRAHVVLAPSISTRQGDRESGMIVLKEAAAVGLPAVATRHGGIPEIIEHERTGLLVPERAPAELAAALIRILADPRLAASFGAAARQKMCSEYDNRIQVERLEAALLSVL